MEIKAKGAYFIKLGKGGGWESECLDAGIMRVRFQEVSPDICVAGDWETIKQIYREAGKDEGTATRFATELERFYTAPPDCLWITFAARRLWWGFAEKGVHSGKNGLKERKIKGGWCSTDIRKRPLDVSTLSSKLIQTGGYRGTICRIEAFDYLLARINAQVLPETQAALDARSEFLNAMIPLIRNLTWRDFEVLVDMTFTAGGWRRIGVLGKTEKTIDLELQQPVTYELAMVQVKSKSNANVVREISTAVREMQQYRRIFIVTHSYQGQSVPAGIDDRIELLNEERLAPMILDAGLGDWLIEKSK